MTDSKIIAACTSPTITHAVHFEAHLEGVCVCVYLIHWLRHEEPCRHCSRLLVIVEGLRPLAGIQDSLVRMLVLHVPAGVAVADRDRGLALRANDLGTVLVTDVSVQPSLLIVAPDAVRMRTLVLARPSLRGRGAWRWCWR